MINQLAQLIVSFVSILVMSAVPPPAKHTSPSTHPKKQDSAERREGTAKPSVRSREINKKNTSKPAPPIQEEGSQKYGSVDFLPLDASWAKPVHHYSGGNYDLQFVNRKLKQMPQQGGYPGDREIVYRSASIHGIPFQLLWAAYGIESGWGKISWKNGVIPYFGLTFDYPGKGTSGNFVTDANRSAQIWRQLYDQYNS